jgi:hypothetical protein
MSKPNIKAQELPVVPNPKTSTKKDDKNESIDDNFSEVANIDSQDLYKNTSKLYRVDK